MGQLPMFVIHSVECDTEIHSISQHEPFHLNGSFVGLLCKKRGHSQLLIILEDFLFLL